jgi:hypothetical protein
MKESPPINHLTYRITRTQWYYFGDIQVGTGWVNYVEGFSYEDTESRLVRHMIKLCRFEVSGYYVALETLSEQRKRLAA